MEFFAINKNTFLHCEIAPARLTRRAHSLDLTPMLGAAPVYHIAEDIREKHQRKDSVSSVSTTAELCVNSFITGQRLSVTSTPEKGSLAGSVTGSSSPRQSFDDYTDSSISEDEYTTVMIRNVPCKYAQDELMVELGMLDLPFNFLYLPPSRHSNGNLGYAFVNFVDPDHAHLFLKIFDEHAWRCQPKSNKRAQPCFATLQGFQQNVQFYSNLKVSKSKCRPFINNDLI
jgi:hypothetical protein